MVIEVSVGGGLAPPVVRVADSVPRVWVAGDGRYIKQGGDGANSAIISLQERRLTEAAVEALLAKAADAGLLAESPDFGTPGVTDAVSTRILIMADGGRHEVFVRALGYPDADLDPATVAAREKVSQFLDLLEHPERVDGAGPPRDFTPAALAVFVLGEHKTPPGPQTPTWPLVDLSTAGSPVERPVAGARCLVVSGADLQAVQSAANGVARADGWRSGNAVWDIALRPMLPDEHTCADVAG